VAGAGGWQELAGTPLGVSHCLATARVPALLPSTCRDALPRLFDSGEERQLLLNLLLHCADISNPVKPSTIAEK
jgi:hypothetical protein